MTKASSSIQTPAKIINPEDITIDDLASLGKDSLPIWALTSGIEVDHNPVDFDRHRYLLPIYMDHKEHDHTITWIKGAQLGATSYQLLRALWWLENHQGRKAGFYFPTNDGVQNLSKDRLGPMIESCPSIKAISSDSGKLNLKNIGKSAFYLYHVGGTASKDSVPMDYLVFDEVRLVSSKDIDQTLHRISASPYKLQTFMSTAGAPNSDIHARYLRGTQLRWHSKCFAGDQRIWVQHKETKKILLRSFKDLQVDWRSYRAASLSTNRKRIVFRDISHFHENGKQQVVKVTFKNGDTVTCTPNHQFAVTNLAPFEGRVAHQVRWVEAKDLLQGSGQVSQRPNNNCVLATKVGVHEKHEVQAPYDLLTLVMVGAYLAEGSFKNPDSSVIEISQLRDKYLWHKAIEWAKSNNLPYNATDKTVTIGLSTRPDLLELFRGCLRGCGNKRLPKVLEGLSSYQAAWVLDAYLAGDGHRRRVPAERRHTDHEEPLLEGEWTAATCSRQLAKDVQMLALRAGYPTYVRKLKVKEGKKPAWAVNYHDRGLYHRSKMSEDVSATYVTSVEYEEASAYVYDITIEDSQCFTDSDHNFVLESGLVVHNCGCPDGMSPALTFPDCIVTDDSKRPGEVYIRCPKCRYTIRNPQNGRYIAGNPGADHNSYAVSQLCSHYRTTAGIWHEYTTTTNKEEFFNAALGVPYIDAANRGVTIKELEDSVNPGIQWAVNETQKERMATKTAMGIDQGGRYNYVVIADINPDGTRKRIRHLEVIESINPEYFKKNEPVSPFVRCEELMKEFNVGICVVDAMPNVNEALAFAQKFPRKVFLASYSNSQEAAEWHDKGKVKASVAKAGPLLRFKYRVTCGRFAFLSMALAAWRDGDVEIPPLHHLRQMIISITQEHKGKLRPEAPGDRLFLHLPRLIKRWKETDEATGEGVWRWEFAGGAANDPHFAHAWGYCNIGLERLRRSVRFNFL